MTGAGSATTAFTVEPVFGAGPSSNPTWYQPGIDVTVSELTVEQALERSRQPDDPTPAGSREGNWEGALSASWSITDGNYHDLVFADGGTALPNSVMQTPSATWYTAIELPDGTVEPRFPIGTIVIDASVNYERGSDVTAELTMLYADEPTELFNSSVTATTATITPSDQEVSVQTSSVDEGEVILYDSNDNELDRVDANSSTWQDTVRVNGRDIDNIQLIRAGAEVAAETIDVNDQTGGSGTTTSTDVDTADVLTVNSVTQPADSDVFTWHGATFTVDTLNQPLMQSASLSLSNLNRFRRGQERHPYDAVTGAIEPSFSTDATFTERDQLVAAVDDTAGTDDGPSKVSGSFTISNGQGVTIEYSMTGLQPQTYSWSDLVAPDADLSEPIDYHVSDVEVL